MAITFPASPSDGDVFTNSTTGVKYIYNATDGVWKTHVWPTNTDYLQLSGGTLTGDLSLGTNDLTAQDINSTTLTTTGGVTVGNGLTVSDGNVVMAAGHGIDFSATADSNTTLSEVLDDYEQGTYTPIVTGGTTAGTTTYFNQNATYVKIGRQVHVSIHIAWTGHTGTGAFRLSLPFQTASSVGLNKAIGACSIMLDSVTVTGTWASLHIPHGNTNAILFSSGSNTNWTQENIDAAGTLIGTITYISET